MTKTTARPDHLNDYYSARADRYDLDAYAYAVHLDTAGMWTPAYERMVTDDIAYMDAYNANRHAGDNGATAARWLAVFARPSFWLVFFVAQCVVALLAR